MSWPRTWPCVCSCLRVVPLRRRGSGSLFGVTAAAADPVGPMGRPFADATPAQIRAALIPEDAEAFDRHWRALMLRATERLDLTEVHEALEAWRQTAMVTSATGVEGYRRMLRTAEERLRTGERAPGAVPWRQAMAERGLAD